MSRLLAIRPRWILLVSLAVVGFAIPARAQYLGGGFGYGGVVPGGVGYGGFAPGGFGGGVGGFGGLGYGGYGGFGGFGGLGGGGYGGYGGLGGFGGGIGHGGFGGGFNGYGGIGYGGYSGIGTALYNPFYINYGLNPTTLATGVTPLAIQSAIANTNMIGSTRGTTSSVGSSRPIVIYLRTPSGKQVQVAK